MVSNSGHVLLIGIDQYSKLGQSAELLGSRNDVLMWHWFCRQHLGIPAENIRMLTSPALDPNKDFGGDTVPAGTVAEATEKAIREGYAWLLANMKGGQSPGLLSYSGHGLLLGGKVPALSTSDMSSDGTGAIALRDIGKAVQDAGAQQALTAVFDCCHVAAPSAKSDLRRTTSLPFGAADAASIDDEDFDVSHRVFLAARPGQEAHQGKLGRSVHGALSFALVTAAEQWKASQAPGQTGLDVNHKQLFKRARKLVRALRMKQSLKLRVPFDRESRSLVRKMPFFGLHSGFTTRKADAPRGGVQIDPSMSNGNIGCLYSLTIQQANAPVQGAPQAAVFSCGMSGGGSLAAYNDQTEYWSMPAGFPSSIPAAGSVVFTATGIPSTGSLTGFPVSEASFTVSQPAQARWEASSSAPASGPRTTLWSSDGTVALDLSQAPAQVIWYKSAPSGEPPAGYVLSGPTTLSNGAPPAPPSTNSWYRLVWTSISPTWSSAAPAPIMLPGTPRSTQARSSVACALASSGNQLYLAVATVSSSGTSVSIYESTDGFTWTGASGITSRSVSSSTAKLFLTVDRTAASTTLYLATDARDCWYWTSAQGWQSVPNASTISGGFASIAACSGVLYVLTGSRIYWCTPSSGNWSYTTVTGLNNYGSLAAFGSQPYLVGSDSNGRIGLWTPNTQNPPVWSEIGYIGLYGAARGVATSVYDGNLQVGMTYCPQSWAIEVLSWQFSNNVSVPGPTFPETMVVHSTTMAGIDSTIFVLAFQDSGGYLYAHYAV